MKIAIIETNNTILKQIDKIQSEFYEVKEECIREDIDIIKLGMELTDLITASYNAYLMLGLDDKISEMYVEKVLRYKQEKGYIVNKFVEVK